MWLQTDDLEHCMIAASYLHYAGFTNIEGFDIAAYDADAGDGAGAGGGGGGRRDPMFVIQATKPLLGGEEGEGRDGKAAAVEEGAAAQQAGL